MPKFEESSIYPLGTALSDRIGGFANEDGWFDSVVQFWGDNGVRLYVFELSDLGRKVVQDLSDGRDDIPAAVLNEVELVLRDRDLDPADLSPYLIEALDAELLELKNRDSARFTSIQGQIRKIMGPKSLDLWSLMVSYG